VLREHRLFVRRVLAYVHVAIALVAYSASIALRRHIDVPTRVFVVNEWTHLTLAMTALILLPLCYALLGVYRSNRLHGFWREAQRLALANVIVFCSRSRRGSTCRSPTACRSGCSARSTRPP
jgi:hypothetical protein